MATPQSIQAGLVGVTGYTGMELTRLLAYHPSIQLVQVTSRKEAGTILQEIYPFLQNLPTGELIITEPIPKKLAANCDVVFLAIPHGAAMNMAAELIELGCKVVDLSADFRIHNNKVYEDWYKVNHSHPELLGNAVYGLPELYANEISQAQLIANPGCYPTASILGLYPALQNKIVSFDDIVIDAKSGTSGAGRGMSIGSLFCEVCDSFKAYNLAGHRHTPEIEQELSIISKKEIHISFNTHLLPINRGILATIYTKITDPNISVEKIHEIYCNTYSEHEFVRVLPLGKLPETKNVRGTMFCDIGLVRDPRVNRLIIVAAIDNICRGASGQAVSNANLMMGLPLHEGLRFAPMIP